MRNRLLIKNADIIVTMDDQRRELSNANIYIDNGVISAIGDALPAQLEDAADEVVNAQGMIITPGLVNTHHHLYQTLTRAVPACQNALLFGWLQTLYPIWATMNPEDIFLASQLGLAELALSGCTMSSDHLYLYPNGARLDDSIHGAQTVGLRFHATRGSMSIGESAGGLPPDSLVEQEAAILNDCIRVIDTYHDAQDGAMTRVAVAPCSPFSVSRELMRDSALLARDKGVMMHTHLAENDEDIAYSQEKFGCTPGQYAEQLGWVGADVWHAHCVKLSSEEIELFAATQTGVAHCPCSNCRLGSGIAPLNAMRQAAVNVGLGVDGSASNDAAHLLSEARQAMLLQRVQNGADAMSARQALELATIGGAKVLSRPDCSGLVVGKRADFALWNRQNLANAGAWDAVAALVLCGPHRVNGLVVDGKFVVRDGELVNLDLPSLYAQAQRAVTRLANH